MSPEIDYRSFYENSPDMLFSVDAKTGNIVECNRTLLTNLGYTKEEVLQKHITEMYHPDESSRVIENYLSFKTVGKLLYSEFKALKKDGSTIDITLKNTPVCDEAGNILYSNAAWRDVSEIIELQRIITLEKEKSEKLLSNMLPEAIVPRLKNEEVVADYHESASVLFIDMVDSTRIFGELSPKETVAWLNEAFSLFDQVIENYDAEKIRTIGDSYMVAAGVPTPSSTHANTLAALALEMIVGLENFNSGNRNKMYFRFGMHSGPLVAGVIGNMRCQYDLWGDTVNIAARLEATGEHGKLHISSATHDLIKDNFVCTPRGNLNLKGIGEMETWYVNAA